MITPHYRNDQVTVYHGDCLNILPELTEASVDAVVTDPPYGLDFMGKHWDTGAVAFDTTVWKHCLRVLKPGGHLLAFGGTRTHHRLACAIEDAGFEIRDSITWLYGSGFPKSLDVSKAIDRAAGAQRERILRIAGGSGEGALNSGTANGWSGSSADSPTAPLAGTKQVNDPITDAAKQWQGWGTALKPAHEPIIVARKPLSGTVANNVLEHGTGALNIDACRVAGEPWKAHSATGLARTKFFTDGETPVIDKEPHTAGRWPTNVAIDEHTAQGIDQDSGKTVSVGGSRGRSGTGWGMDAQPDVQPGYGDEGGASRFFPTFRYEPKAPGTERPTADDGTQHATVKPLDLMRWLIRLVTPPHGLVLDPFAGSGTTAEAAIHEHMRCITIEQEADYLPVIVKRLHKPMQIGFDYDIGEFDT